MSQSLGVWRHTPLPLHGRRGPVLAGDFGFRGERMGLAECPLPMKKGVEA
jgi:hypothetical protein